MAADRIESITLRRTLPQVFRGDVRFADGSGSRVWLQELELKRTRRYLISAESGKGKSSLCAYLYGSRCDYDGAICFNDRDIATFTTDDWCRLRRYHIAYLPQDMRLFPELTVMENLQLKNSLTDTFDTPELAAMLDYLGIADKADTPAGRLSVGQMQRVAVIRALCQPMDFLLLDEPVSHLDEVNNRAVAALIDKVTADNGAAVIATSVGNHLLLDYDKTIQL